MPYKKNNTRVRTRRNNASLRTQTRNTIRGKGAYTVQNGPWANRGANLGGLVGGYYGGPIGKAFGSWAGRRLFHYPAKLFGSGSYTMTNEGTTKLAPQVPEFVKNAKDNSVTITHREYLGDVITSGTAGAFKIQSYGLNPSEINTFPWLSNIAQPNFQQYKFDGMAFEFRSFSADALNSTNTALGSVFACINYDYTDSNPTSRYEVENTDWSRSSKPSDNFLVPVECENKQTAGNGLLYIVNGNNIPPNTDPKTYYLGKLWIGTTGFQGTNVNIGSLYVTYKVKLYKPLMTKPLSNALIFLSARSGATVGVLWGPNEISNINNCDSIGVTINGNVLTMDNSRLVIGQIYLLNMEVTGGSNTCSCPTPTISSGASGINYFSDTNAYDATINNNPPVASTTTKINMSFVFLITNNSAPITITLSGGGYPTSPISQIGIFQICGIYPEQIGKYIP